MPRKRDLNPFAALQRVFTNPQVRRLCVAFFLFFLAFNGFTAVLVLYFKQAFGWGPGLAGAAFLAVALAGCAAQPARTAGGCPGKMAGDGAVTHG